MKSPNRKVVLHINGPCPCGSGKVIAACHLDFDGRFRKHVPSLRPPGQVTGYSHPSCYLSGTHDCSEQISREHYMSKAILEQLGSKLAVIGMPWLPAGQALEVSIASLTAKILCKRHNESLSPLDAEAAHFFSVLRQTLIDLRRKSLSRKPVFQLVSGEALELWMIKVACGIYYSIGSKDQEKLSRTHTINLTKVERALFERAWDPRANFRAATGSKITVQDNVAVAPLASDIDLRFCGAIVTMHGFALEALFDDHNTNPYPWPALTKRPSELVLRRGKREHHIVITWPPGTPEACVIMDEGPPVSAHGR